MGAGKRLNYYIEKQGFTKKTFCEEYDLEYNNMTSIFAERRAIGINILNKIHSIFPKMNVHWLLYDEGNEELDIIPVLNESQEKYAIKNDYEKLEEILLKLLDKEEVKNKIHEMKLVSL